MVYQEEEKLELKYKIGVTEKVYLILRKLKKEKKISMAKIICNLILEKYERDTR